MKQLPPICDRIKLGEPLSLEIKKSLFNKCEDAYQLFKIRTN